MKRRGKAGKASGDRVGDGIRDLASAVKSLQAGAARTSLDLRALAAAIILVRAEREQERRARAAAPSNAARRRGSNKKGRS